MNTKMLGMLGLLAMAGSAYAKADDTKVSAPAKHEVKKTTVAKADEKKGATPAAKEEKKTEMKAEEKKDTGTTAAVESPDAGTPAKATKKAAPKK
jgi:hypothetical protein